MARGWDVKLEGIEPFRRKLKKLPDKIRKRVVKSAVTRAGAVVRMHARKLVKHKAIDDGLPNGHLYAQIRNKTSFHKGTPVATVGAEYDKDSVAHFVHQGTPAHAIPVPWLPEPIKHPGSKAFPFMDIALDQSRVKSQAALVKTLAAGIAKELTKQQSK